jgi:ferredoxin
VGSETGADVARALPLQPASDADRQQAEELLDRTARSMGRRLETDQLKQLLQGNLEHPRWQEVAERCLACGNCTLVCPTCFCFAVDDSTDLSGQTAERHQRWDSCFTLGHSYIHGGSVRGEIRSRYRQWMTHKLAHWLDQFGVSGCVGCGRCITWCPVGIDITEEVAAIRAGGWRP